MSFLTDIGPLEAMRIFYQGEEYGVWKGDTLRMRNREASFCRRC